jgi:hypothetical protein
MRQRCWVAWQPGRAPAIRLKELLSNRKGKRKKVKGKVKSKARRRTTLGLTFNFFLFTFALVTSVARVAIGQKPAAE